MPRAAREQNEHRSPACSFHRPIVTPPCKAVKTRCAETASSPLFPHRDSLVGNDLRVEVQSAARLLSRLLPVFASPQASGRPIWSVEAWTFLLIAQPA